MGKKNVPTKEVLKNYAENTSAHGIKKLTDDNGVLLKLVWIVLLLVATGLILYQVTMLILLYFRHPVITQTSIETTSLKFPSVTFCNLNPVLNSKAKEDRIYDPVQKISNYLKVPLYRFDYNESIDDLGVADNYTFDSVDLNSEDPLDEALIEFKTELMSAPRAVIESLSQTFNKFVVSCQFGGIDCELGNFTKTFDSDYGLCYTFPNQTLKPDGISVYSAGPLYGLKLMLNVNQKEYIPFVTTSAGVRVQVHEFGSKPHMLELGYSLSTGFETEIGVKPMLYQRLPDPHGDCDNSGEFETVLDCERQCVELFIINECGCTRLADFPDQSVQFCGTNETICIKNILNLKQTGKINCPHCKATCRMYDFETKMSMTRWPASHYDPAVLFKLKKWTSSESINMMDESERRDNLLTMNIYYSQLSLQKVEEEPAYEWENLLSDIGGQLGLWLGISVLSICEVLELLYLLGRNCCRPKSKVDSDE